MKTDDYAGIIMLIVGIIAYFYFDFTNNHDYKLIGAVVAFAGILFIVGQFSDDKLIEGLDDFLVF